MTEQIHLPEWASEPLPDDHVWCPACRSGLCLDGMQWPEPGGVGADHGESVRQWISCYVESDDGLACDEDILIKRIVSDDGSAYAGPPVNDWPEQGVNDHE